MTILFSLTLGMTVFCGVALGSFFVFTRTSRATLQRIYEVTYGNRRVQRVLRPKWTAGRRVFTAVRWVRARPGLGEEAGLGQRLANAGCKGSTAADVYNAARVLCPAAGVVAGAFLPGSRMFWMMALPAIGFIAPNVTLTRLIARRREKIRRSIPDAIDLLVICVDAGLGIDQALLRVGQELGPSHPEITEELLQINREQRAGKPRVEAWEDMARRSELDDINAFAAMLMQTERFGTPVARALSTFADTIRMKRRQLAEEAAAKTTVKIIFPLVLFIFPSLFLVLLGPAALSIVRGMAAMSH